MKILDAKLLAMAGGVTVLLAQGCVMGDGDVVGEPGDEELLPLADADELLAGAPKADDIDRRHTKADGTLPDQFDLVDSQTPVRSQGRRGTCSMFSTTALMEHLYIQEGTLTDPDFSEQYLQWSTKVELGRFTDSSGSTAQVNISAINQFGIPEEQHWPYEADPWDETVDPACEGSGKPTRCFTNGNPPDEALDAPKFHLPEGSYLHPQDIKAHMKQNGQAVTAGMTVYYQAWNHGASSLPLNDENRARGIVTTPNEADVRESNQDRAGHSVLLVGWDDELEIQRRDENGEPMVDRDGDPVMDRGFYIFKNSWGTSSWGSENEYGAGYGLISQEYVHDHASLRIADLPQNVTPPEGDTCPDPVDCSDPACAEEPICDDESDELSFEGAGGDIPDNDPVGYSSTIAIEEEGTIAELSVDVNITHTYRGDLTVTLYRGDEAVVLHEQSGGNAEDLVETYEVEEFEGADLAGEWKLTVTDTASLDTGSLDSWSLRAVAR